MAADDRHVPEAAAMTSARKGGDAPAPDPQPTTQTGSAPPASRAQDLNVTEIENELAQNSAKLEPASPAARSARPPQLPEAEDPKLFSRQLQHRLAGALLRPLSLISLLAIDTLLESCFLS